MAKAAKATVKINEENPEPEELIASSIIQLAEGVEKLNKSRLNQRAILVLLKDMTGISMNQIDRILKAVGQLKTHYLKELPKK